MNKLSFFVEGTPVPMPRPRVNTKTGHVFSNDARTKDWKEKIMWAARGAGIRPGQAELGPVRLTLAFVLKRSEAQEGLPHVFTPDGDNLAKLALDAMTRAGAWKDDCQVYDLRVIKRYGERTGVLITIEE